MGLSYSIVCHGDGTISRRRCGSQMKSGLLWNGSGVIAGWIAFGSASSSSLNLAGPGACG